jgi:hypothetical protein
MALLKTWETAPHQRCQLLGLSDAGRLSLAQVPSELEQLCQQVLDVPGVKVTCLHLHQCRLPHHEVPVLLSE